MRRSGQQEQPRHTEGDPYRQHHNAAGQSVVVEVGDAVHRADAAAGGHDRSERRHQPGRNSGGSTPPLVAFPMTSMKIDASGTPTGPKMRIGSTVAPRRPRRQHHEAAPAEPDGTGEAIHRAQPDGAGLPVSHT